MIDAQPGLFLIRKVCSLEELLNMPILDSGSPDKHKKDIRSELDAQMELSLKE